MGNWTGGREGGRMERQRTYRRVVQARQQQQRRADRASQITTT